MTNLVMCCSLEEHQIAAHTYPDLRLNEIFLVVTAGVVLMPQQLFVEELQNPWDSDSLPPC